MPYPQKLLFANSLKIKTNLLEFYKTYHLQAIVIPIINLGLSDLSDVKKGREKDKRFLKEDRKEDLGVWCVGETS